MKFYLPTPPPTPPRKSQKKKSMSTTNALESYEVYYLFQNYLI